MSAEPLIALEAAVGEIGALYTVARTFTVLHERAERELLPQLVALGSRLRALVRRSELNDAEVDVAARAIMGVGSEWRVALEQVHASQTYHTALAAFAADRQEELAALIPQVFAGMSLRQPAPDLYIGFSPSAGRRRPGARPFLGAAECAERLTALLRDGIAPESSGTEWWERELPAIECAADPEETDAPIWLHVAAGDVRVAVFDVVAGGGCYIFAPRLRAPMSVGIATAVSDEWWQAYEDSYEQFSVALRQELDTRGITIDP